MCCCRRLPAGEVQRSDEGAIDEERTAQGSQEEPQDSNGNNDRDDDGESPLVMVVIVMMVMVVIAMTMEVVVMVMMFFFQANDLVFIKNSPDYCHTNHTIGSLGENHYHHHDTNR